MAKDSKYHPTDVRYKGPSTAYRGSAHGKPKQNRQTSVTKRPAVKSQTATNAGPWGGQKAPAPPRPAPPVPPSPSAIGVFGFLIRGIKGTYRTIRNAYLLVLFLILAAMFFGTPMLDISGFSTGPTQMVPME